MDKSIKDKLFAARTYEDAKPILETLHAGLSAHKLFDLGHSVQTKQPLVAKDLFSTAIQEIEDKEKKVEETDGGSSEQSSSTTGLEKVGTEQDAPESASAQPDKKDQMGVVINETFPPQPGMMPPQQQTGGQCGQVPPMNPQQQMQYTINETVRRALQPMQEAIKALDKKIQETQKQQPSSLELGSKLGHVKSAPVIRETSTDKKESLAQARNDIKRMNDYLNSQR